MTPRNGRIQARKEATQDSAPDGLNETRWGSRMNQSSRPTTDRERVALIRSLIGWSDGRETQVLEQVQAVLNGATLEDLMAEVAA